MKSGNTTRKVDRAIQDLFNNGIAYLYEGREEEESAHREAMGVFQNRMTHEHGKIQYAYRYGCYDGVWCYKIETHKL